MELTFGISPLMKYEGSAIMNMVIGVKLVIFQAELFEPYAPQAQW